MAKKEDIIITPFISRTIEERVAQLESLLMSHTHDGRETRGISGNLPNVSSDTAAPTTTPKKIGDIFVDKTNSKVYISTGTSSSSDWKILN